MTTAMKRLNKKSIVTVEGVIVSRREAGDDGCYIDIFTNERGIIETAVYGAKKMTSRLTGCVSLFTYGKFCLNKSGSRYSLNSAEPIYTFHKLSENFTALSLASYFAETARYTAVPEPGGNTENLRFFAVTLFELETARLPLPLIKAVFEFRRSAEIGFVPDLTKCKNCTGENFSFSIESGNLICQDCSPAINNAAYKITAETSELMRHIIFSVTDKVYRFDKPVTETAVRELGNICEQYLLYHTGGKFRTLDYYKKTGA
jgi:DNA repair protein RecO (recombination protein O)